MTNMRNGGCFPPLRIPNERPDTLDKSAENWRALEHWANPLIDSCGAKQPAAIMSNSDFILAGDEGVFLVPLPVSAVYNGMVAVSNGVDVPTTGFYTAEFRITSADDFSVTGVELSFDGFTAAVAKKELFVAPAGGFNLCITALGLVEVANNPVRPRVRNFATMNVGTCEFTISGTTAI